MAKSVSTKRKKKQETDTLYKELTGKTFYDTDPGIAYRYNALFLRADGTDIRDLPRVKHPVTGNLHFDHGGWPIQK